MKQKLKSILILAIGVALAWWFVRRLDWQAVATHLRGARIWPLVVASVFINLTMIARSLRWRVLLEPIAQVSFRNLFAATSIGFGGIFVFGRAFEVVRPFVLSLRERIQPSATLATILVERLFDSSAVVLLFALNMLFFEPPAGTVDVARLQTIRSVGLLFLLGIVCAVAVLIVLRLKSATLLGWLERKATKLPQKIVTPLLNLIRHLSEGLSVLLNVSALLRTTFYSACVWALVTSATWLTLYAFHLDFSLGHTIFILGFGLIGSVVPTPGGSAGAFHEATSKALEFLGLETNLAASIAIVYHLVAFGSPFICGLYFLVREGISLKQLREMIASEQAHAAPVAPQAQPN